MVDYDYVYDYSPDYIYDVPYYSTNTCINCYCDPYYELCYKRRRNNKKIRL